MASLLPLFDFLFLTALTLSDQQWFISVNYGQVTSIKQIRLYGSDPDIIKALSNTGTSNVIGMANGEIPSLASDPNAAATWINSHVVPFYPASNITLINVSNEVLLSNDQGLISQLLLAMRNVQSALAAALSEAK